MNPIQVIDEQIKALTEELEADRQPMTIQEGMGFEADRERKIGALQYVRGVLIDAGYEQPDKLTTEAEQAALSILRIAFATGDFEKLADRYGLVESQP